MSTVHRAHRSVQPDGTWRTARHRWALLTAAGALVVSATDALLLEFSRGFFKGGFLSVDYLQGPVEMAMFFVASMLVDAALIGVVTALVVYALRWTRLHVAAATWAGAAVATGALVGADLVSYQVLRYLGDAFDFALMFDLAGGLSEVFAVAGDRLVGPLLIAQAVMVVTVAMVWTVQRRARGSPEPRPGVRFAGAPAVLAAVGLLTLVVASASSNTLENGLLRKPAGRVLALAANALSDVDRDGFGIVGRLSDPDAFDASVFPYALDVPGNGIDENGVGGDLPADTAVPALPAVHKWQRRPDVVLFVLESFRADLVGARVGGVPVTPVMDAVAARGLSVPDSYSHNGYTVQSRFHLLGGRLPNGHGGGSLIDDFKANGYQVGYFSGQDESFGGPRYDVGFTRADVTFDARDDRGRRYSTSTTPGSLAVPFAVVRERVTEFLQMRGAGDAPLFLYVNFHDTHFPYSHDGVETLTSPARLPRERIAPAEQDALRATYTNTAANVDRAIGSVLDAVRRARGAEPGIIITADHGESLFDEGFLGHGYALNDVQTRIPLLVANLPLEVPVPFGQTDLRPAIDAALSGEAESAAPRATPVAEREIFQYLGTLSRPRQVAFVRAGVRTIFDFRNQRVQVENGPWRRPDELSGADRQEFLRLVHYWERLMLDQHEDDAVGQAQ